MTIQHKQLIVEQYAHVKDKVFTLKEFATGSEGDVSDPFGGASIYQETRDELETLLYQLAKSLNRIINPHKWTTCKTVAQTVFLLCLQMTRQRLKYNCK